MTRWLLAALVLAAGFDAAACPLCLGAYQSSPAEQLLDMSRAVLAAPAVDGHAYRVVETIKGARPSGGTIDASAVQLKAPARDSATPLLFVTDDGWPMWISVGAIGATHARWLRAIAAGKHPTEMSAAEWQTRLELMLPGLESPEPLVAEIAYGEFAAAPYTALLAMKSRLRASDIRRWLADPKLAARQPMYLLLLGIAGDAHDAARLEQSLETAWASGDAANLGSLIAADLQLRGAARMAWVDARYLLDPKRSTPEIEAALLALSVHGNANGVIARERVIESYRWFMKEHQDIAGFVARDLASWRYWDAVPEYVALMKSDLKQQYPSRVAIIAYLQQSPGGAGGMGLPASALVGPRADVHRSVPMLAP